MPIGKNYFIPPPPEGSWPALKDPWEKYWSYKTRVNNTKSYNILRYGLPGFTWGVSLWMATFVAIKSWRLITNNPKPEGKRLIGEVHAHSPSGF
ncbi:hypothetical protein ACHWQZ_G011934 [Mnemiopsis leidyi]